MRGDVHLFNIYATQSAKFRNIEYFYLFRPLTRNNWIGFTFLCLFFFFSVESKSSFHIFIRLRITEVWFRYICARNVARLSIYMKRATHRSSSSMIITSAHKTYILLSLVYGLFNLNLVTDVYLTYHLLQMDCQLNEQAGYFNRFKTRN